MYQVNYKTVINHRVRNLQLAFPAKTAEEAIAQAKNFLADNKVSWYVITATKKLH